MDWAPVCILNECECVYSLVCYCLNLLQPLHLPTLWTPSEPAQSHVLWLLDSPPGANTHIHTNNKLKDRNFWNKLWGSNTICTEKLIHIQVQLSAILEQKAFRPPQSWTEFTLLVWTFDSSHLVERYIHWSISQSSLPQTKVATSAIRNSLLFIFHFYSVPVFRCLKCTTMTWHADKCIGNCQYY